MDSCTPNPPQKAEKVLKFEAQNGVSVENFFIFVQNYMTFPETFGRFWPKNVQKRRKKSCQFFAFFKTGQKPVENSPKFVHFFLDGLDAHLLHQ